MRQFLVLIVKYSLRRTVGRLIGLLKNKPKKIVIITNGRTGSNLLMKLLWSDKKIWQNSEIFGEFRLRSKLACKFINLLGPSVYLADSFNRIFTEDFVINKILYYQLEKEHGDQFGIRGMDNLSEQLIADPSFSFIHLKRKDRLSNIVSNRLAYMNNQWVAGGYAIDTVRLEPEWTREMMDEAMNWENKYDTEVTPDRIYTLYYEDLIANPQHEIDKLCEFIGIRPFPVEIKTKKQNKKPLHEVIENYDELKNYFADSEYAYLFSN